MTKTLLLASTALLLTATSAFAGDAPQVAEAPVPTGPTSQAPLTDAAQRGVLVFTPDFFAAQRPNTALDMVNRVPGFSVDDGSGARGFEGAVGNVLINNNRPASKNDSGSNVLSRTPAGQVERIELIRGGAAGIDMQGFSVVVNVILKKETSRQSILTWNTTQFEGSGQDLYGGSYQFTARNGDRSWGVTLSDGISMSDSNGPGRTIRRNAAGVVIRDEQTEQDGYGGGNAIRGTYAGPLAGGKIDLTARYGVNDWHGPNLSRSATTFRESLDDQDSKSGEFGATWTRALSPRFNLETRLMHEFGSWDGLSTYNVLTNGVDAPEQRFAYSGDRSETILRALVRQEWSPKLTVETGGEIAYNMRQTDQAYSEGGVAIPLPSASVKVEETRGEAFSKGTWRVDSNLTLEAGLRLETSTISQSGDANQEKSFFFAKPRLLATWTPRPNNQLRLRFEREVGQLDFSDFAASADLNSENVYGGNVNLVPEQRWISELAYERRFWGEGIVSIAYRHDQIVDAIDRIPLADGLSAVGNIGDGTLDQLSLNVTVPLTKLGVPGARFRFKNDWNKTSVTDPTTGLERPISGVRASQANVGFEQDIASWKLQWGVNWLPHLGQGNYSPDQVSKWRGANYFETFVEYKPSPTLSIRTQLNVWNDFTQTRTVFADRQTRAVLFTEDSEVDPRTFVSIRVRKTF
ncbi:TonB-dependent receptor domain-containing protein [Brevundimonas sp.]|uniref:TonB-dependent receptor plug domain-containing protein n=1 Tax=Brevundimonas sp. TaxID=1871086 RepID=UPI0028A0FE09|nr:TonB-dependent receptor [Brevundimonas sp.]